MQNYSNIHYHQYLPDGKAPQLPLMRDYSLKPLEKVKGSNHESRKATMKGQRQPPYEYLR